MKTFKDLEVGNYIQGDFREFGPMPKGKPWVVLNPENNAVLYVKKRSTAKKLQWRWRVLHGRDVVTGEAIDPKDDIEILEKTFAPGELVIGRYNGDSQQSYIETLDGEVILEGPVTLAQAQAWVDDHTAVQE